MVFTSLGERPRALDEIPVPIPVRHAKSRCKYRARPVPVPVAEANAKNASRQSGRTPLLVRTAVNLFTFSTNMGGPVGGII